MKVSNSLRYHIIPDSTGKEIMIFDSQTGAVKHPVCWQDLSAYYHYLANRGQFDAAQKLLQDTMIGNKPITRMVVGLLPKNRTPGFA